MNVEGMSAMRPFSDKRRGNNDGVASQAILHGVAGFQVGCRCSQCSDAEAYRMRRIGRAEHLRWARVNARADQSWVEHEYQQLVVNTNQGKRWTADDVALALDTSIPLCHLADVLGRSTAAVEYIRRRHRNRR